MKEMNENVKEKEICKASGGVMLAVVIIGFLICAALMVACGFAFEAKNNMIGAVEVTIGSIGFATFGILCAGFRIVNPNEALVLVLFGKYYGTVKKAGFYFVNPFAVNMMPNQEKEKKVSLKHRTLDNKKQKVNDKLGNPVIIGSIVIWKVVNPTKALFDVENYKNFLSIQCDATIRTIARLYPYDVMEEDLEDEKTLRGSSMEIAENMREELQKKVEDAGIVVEEVKITHLSYAEEIAAAMLQKQQAVAVIAARKKIVEGAVGMVEMAIDQLGEQEVVVLDEERKAAMVSNLLVVLCGNKDAQPIVNSGSIY